MMNAALASIGDKTMLANIVDALYGKILDDYRINRFFNGRPAAEQAEPLKAFLNAALYLETPASELSELLDDYFMAAFARTDTKPSLVTGNDFAFLLDIVGGREIRPITLLCDAHSHLLKLGPDDFHYDIVMTHLADSLRELDFDGEIMEEVLAIGESGRDGVLGRGIEIFCAAA